ncbi:MAG: hypothetical protein A2Y65_07055 [Deltaproteobacteria bacterium RBG_13_52_11]|nr:MAG: hypothetical protein A2Y65_07055 [Deltaproteobacteria bacterium RBG_13_52_11]
MKNLILLPVVLLLLLIGCKYEAPLTEEHSISIDQSVLGLWELVPDKGKQLDQNERMMILKYADTEYLIHYPIGKEGMYFRAYPVKIGGVPCVQIQIIGTAEGNLDKDNKELFHVVSYQLSNGELIIKILNTNLVDDGLKDSEALKKAFLKHKDDKNLFKDPGRFRKIERRS